MDEDLKRSLGKRKDHLGYVFYNAERRLYQCFDVQRQDGWSKSKIAFPFDVPLSRVARVYSVIKSNWNKPIDPFCDPKHFKDCKFDNRALVPLLIEHFRLPVGLDKFRNSKSEYNSPYYYWPMHILQALGRVRFGRSSWRLA